MLLKRLVVFGALVVPAFAQAEVDIEGVDADCNLECLIKKCKQLENDPQTKPFTTKIYCSGSKTFWEVASEGTFKLRNHAKVSNRGEMKDGRYRLAKKTYLRKADPSPAQCETLRQMRVDIPAVVTVLRSCQELQDMAKEGRDAFCLRVLEGAGEESPVATGQKFSTCPGKDEEGSEETSLSLGATLSVVSFSHSGRSYQGLEIESLDDSDGLLARSGFQVGQILAYLEDSMIKNVETLQNALAKNAGKEVDIMYFDRADQVFRSLPVQL